MVGVKKQAVLTLLGLAMAGVLTAAQRGGGGQAPADGGQVPAAPGGAQQPAGGGGRGARGGGAPAAPLGLTITGEVPNYVPVTDAMLRKLPDGDWLMIRRDYSRDRLQSAESDHPGERERSAAGLHASHE